MTMATGTPTTDQVRIAQSAATTFRTLTWNLTIPVQVSLAVGPSVQAHGNSTKAPSYSVDIGARGGVGGGVETYFVSSYI